MNKLTALFAAVFTAAMLFCNHAIAAVPVIENIGIPALVDCAVDLTHETAFYSDKIFFNITGALKARLPEDQAKLDKLPRDTDLDIKVRDDPKRISNIKNKVLTFIGAQPNAANRTNIKIVDVSYSVVLCAEAP